MTNSSQLTPGAELNSAFQPILSLSHQRHVGYEALLRTAPADRSNAQSPGEVFAQATSEAELHALEQLTQRMHAQAFSALPSPDGNPAWLFLNLNQRLIASGGYKETLPKALEAAGVPPHQVVVEMLETPGDNKRLAEAVHWFREFGCLVALDDFGTGYSNFERLLELTPDLVKLDRSLIQRAVEEHAEGRRRILNNLVALIQEAGSLVVLEGVETERQALTALDADVDFVQGFFFAHPTQVGPDSNPDPGLAPMRRVTEKFTEHALEELTRERSLLRPYAQAFLRAAARLEAGSGLRDSCTDLLKMPYVQRCYVLNGRGEQIDEHVLPQQREATGEPTAMGGAPVAAPPDRRYSPLIDTRGGNWLRRHYYRDACMERRRLKISRPYRSSTGSHVCVTLSIAETPTGEASPYVFCCDLLWRPANG